MGLLIATKNIGSRKYACRGSLPLACILPGGLIEIDGDLVKILRRSYLGDHLYKVDVEIVNAGQNGRVLSLSLRTDDIFYLYEEVDFPRYLG